MVGAAAREWLAEGEAIGFAKGRAAGRAKALVLVLGQRFGAISETDKARVHGASLDEVDRWLARVSAASSLADAFAPEY